MNNALRVKLWQTLSALPEVGALAGGLHADFALTAALPYAVLSLLPTHSVEVDTGPSIQEGLNVQVQLYGINPNQLTRAMEKIEAALLALSNTELLPSGRVCGALLSGNELTTDPEREQGGAVVWAATLLVALVVERTPA